MALAALFSTVPAGATVLRFVPFEEQVDSAGVIVVATALSSEAAMRGGLIFTDVVFRVEEAVKGSPGATVTVRTPGGVVGEIGQSVDGTPKFDSGGRYVLFLEPGQGDLWRVVGFSQGCYTVSRAEEGKQKVRPQMAAAANVHLLGGGEGMADAAGTTLDEFLNRVRARLDGVKARSVEE